jgi:hypothetical protein
VIGAAVCVQTFPVGHGQEGPQQDISDCDTLVAATQGVTLLGALISEITKSIWQSVTSNLFTGRRVT